MLKGRSPEEVERIFNTMEAATREQGATLTKLSREMTELKTQTAAPPAPAEPAVSAQDFFNDPMAQVRKEMSRQIEPLVEEIRGARDELTAPNAREKLAREYGDWGQVEPYIDVLITQQNFPNPNDEGLLRMLYLTAKGYMTHQGISIDPAADPQPQPGLPQQQPVVAPPQHRASTPPPPPPPTPQQPQVRELSENERRLARESGMSAEQYIKWQEMDMDEVAEADFDSPPPPPPAEGAPK